jgi:diguanylate cyclase (GGDEF)-like protein
MHSAEYARRFVHPDDSDMVRQQTQKAIETTDPLFKEQIDHRILYADGTTGYITVRFLIVKGSHGRTVKTYGVNQDITERKRAEEALKKSEGFLNSTLDSLTAHITVLDDRGGIILTNKAYRDFAAQNGIEPRTVSEGANYFAVCDTASGEHSEEATPLAEGIRDVLSGKRRSFKLEYPCHSPDEERWFIAHVTPFDSECSRRVVVTHEIITERKRAEEIIKTAHKQLQTKNSLLDALSKTDQLTGIANRRRTQQVIEQEIDRFNRYKQPFCIFLFDIDHFKAVNDNHGHEVGDQVLVELVGLVQSVIRRTDTLGRWGGEEFILVCPETSLPTAQTIAEKICTAVREYQFAQGLGITLSIGVSEIQSGETLKEILVEVDRKMYLAKQKGRDRVEL